MFLTWTLSKLQKVIADRQTIVALSAMDDRRLEDVGLSRWEIPDAVRSERDR
jgi:uncharacterized protein YjiS (DUF1127 family)